MQGRANAPRSASFARTGRRRNRASWRETPSALHHLAPTRRAPRKGRRGSRRLRASTPRPSPRSVQCGRVHQRHRAAGTRARRRRSQHRRFDRARSIASAGHRPAGLAPLQRALRCHDGRASDRGLDARHVVAPARSSTTPRPWMRLSRQRTASPALNEPRRSAGPSLPSTSVVGPSATPAAASVSSEPSQSM